MIGAVIILSIALIGSGVFNVLLLSSKNSSVKRAKKVLKENREIKSENVDFRTIIAQLESKVEKTN